MEKVRKKERVSASRLTQTIDKNSFIYVLRNEPTVIGSLGEAGSLCQEVLVSGKRSVNSHLLLGVLSKSLETHDGGLSSGSGGGGKHVGSSSHSLLAALAVPDTSSSSLDGVLRERNDKE